MIAVMSIFWVVLELDYFHVLILGTFSFWYTWVRQTITVQPSPRDVLPSLEMKRSQNEGQKKSYDIIAQPGTAQISSLVEVIKARLRLSLYWFKFAVVSCLFPERIIFHNFEVGEPQVQS